MTSIIERFSPSAPNVKYIQFKADNVVLNLFNATKITAIFSDVSINTVDDPSEISWDVAKQAVKFDLSSLAPLTTGDFNVTVNLEDPTLPDIGQLACGADKDLIFIIREC